MRPIFTFATIIALAAAPMIVLAKPGNPGGNGRGNGNGNGHGNGHSQEVIGGDHGCPPGLAWRSPACVPPGLALQGVTTEDWIGPITTAYHEGDILTLDDFIRITNLNRYGLPVLPDGQQYAVVDNTLVRIDSQTYQILQLIRAFATLVN
jgi:hypothetical protein